MEYGVAADNRSTELLALASAVVSVHVSTNKVSAGELGTLIRSVHQAFAELKANGVPASRPEPAVPINRSVKPDYLVCLEDGIHLKMLKRYLRTHYQITPDQYRERWGLSGTYPIVAPNYAKKRIRLAKAAGLGKRTRSKRS